MPDHLLFGFLQLFLQPHNIHAGPETFLANLQTGQKLSLGRLKTETQNFREFLDDGLARTSAIVIDCFLQYFIEGSRPRGFLNLAADQAERPVSVGVSL